MIGAFHARLTLWLWALIFAAVLVVATVAWWAFLLYLAERVSVGGP